VKFYGHDRVDGILADLGVSSHQFDEADRGFSTRWDGLLDMRMDRQQALSAREVVNTYSERDLIHLLSAYGEIRNARTLAAALIQARISETIESTGQLREIAGKCAPRGKQNQYLAQVFQAIRIEVNDELGALRTFLEESAVVLKPGGRLVVISYHSLEDRLVKNFMIHGNFQGQAEKDLYGNVLRPLEPVHRKPFTPEKEEIEKNNRARSARMRVAKKI
jgi:16S rRNA (cytosine1402-N4)-methyltransferase